MINPDPGVYGLQQQPNVRNSHLDTLAGSVEDRLKINPMFSLIGGIRFEDFQLSRDGSNFDGSPVTGQPFTANWTPVSYRAGYKFEPVKGLMFYSMYATAYDPAAAGIFSISPGNSLALTSARITRPASSICSGTTALSGRSPPMTLPGITFLSRSAIRNRRWPARYAARASNCQARCGRSTISSSGATLR